jgi:hypothetical protein
VEKVNKSFLSISIIFFGISIILGSWFVSNALKDIAFNQHLGADTVTVTQPGENEWELIVVNENNIILFNTISGEYWRKFIESGEGPTAWEKSPLPWEE